MDVVYTSPWQKIATVVKLASDEDADVVGVSSLATDHLLLPQLVASLREAGLDHVRVVVGGIVPPQEERDLLAAGIARVFHPGSARHEIVTVVAELARLARSAANLKFVR
jgi:methylmalonyl-CoA mutase C-terminal domain/subunit